MTQDRYFEKKNQLQCVFYLIPIFGERVIYKQYFAFGREEKIKRMGRKQP